MGTLPAAPRGRTRGHTGSGHDGPHVARARQNGPGTTGHDGQACGAQGRQRCGHTLHVPQLDGTAPPNVGVSRAAGSRRNQEEWRHETALKSRAQVAAAPAASVARVVGPPRGYFIYVHMYISVVVFLLIFVQRIYFYLLTLCYHTYLLSSWDLPS